MLHLFNPIQILKMDNDVVEAIAAEDKQTRDRRLALRDQKKAIEEAKSLCASLAMRSELRGHDDFEDGPESEDEEDTRRYSSGTGYSQPQQQQQQQQAPQQSQTHLSQQWAPEHTPREYRNSHQQAAQPTPASVQRKHPTQEQPNYGRDSQQGYRQEQQQQQQPVTPGSGRASRAEQPRVSSEWAAQNGPGYYGADGPSVPAGAPPPPPRPPRPDLEEPKKESTRHRIMGSLAR